VDICRPQVSPSVDEFNQLKAYHDGRLLRAGQEANRLSVFAVPEGSASGKPCRGKIGIEGMPPCIVKPQSEGVVTDTEAVTTPLRMEQSLPLRGTSAKVPTGKTVTYEWGVRDTWPVSKHGTQSPQEIANMILKYPWVTSPSKDRDSSRFGYKTLCCLTRELLQTVPLVKTGAGPELGLRH